ncbi:sulfotransferase family protein [Agarivorans sp. QJM3NY_25]|uniref:sulfotransferase family protein n=1 Tax=Agarivorans sp. QJM3NY_25 TaxID=3421430 RepID=UPI003D7E81F6
MEAKAIIVIGMHRSGTSALSGELAQFGVFMGKHLFKAQAGVNDKGFWENAHLVDFNDQLFDELGSSWEDPCYCLHPARSFSEAWQQRALQLIEQEYAGSAVWGMKDPRVSVLLPLWRPVLERSPAQINYLLMIRNPVEVAGSLAKRDGFSQAKGLMLWLNYNFLAYRETNQSSRLVVDFADLLVSPETVRRQISERFELDLITQGGGSFIEQKLRRNVASAVHREGELARLAEQTYQAILAGDPDLVEQLYQQYQQYLSQLDPVLVEHILRLQRAESDYRNLFESAYRSFTWKLSWPLRTLEKRLTKALLPKGS